MKKKLLKLWLHTKSTVIGTKYVIIGIIFRIKSYKYYLKESYYNDKEIRRSLARLEKMHKELSDFYAEIVLNGFNANPILPNLIESVNELLYSINQYLETGYASDDNLTVSYQIGIF